MSQISLHQASVTRFIERLDYAFHEGDLQAERKLPEYENVRRLREVYEAIARADFGPAIALMADDIDMEMCGAPGTPLVGRWRGRDRAAEAMARNFASLEAQQAELLSLVAQGDTVVLLAHERGRLRATGKPYEMYWTQFFTFRDGQLIRLRCVFDTAAMRDAGQA